MADLSEIFAGMLGGGASGFAQIEGKRIENLFRAEAQNSVNEATDLRRASLARRAAQAKNTSFLNVLNGLDEDDQARLQETYGENWRNTVTNTAQLEGVEDASKMVRDTLQRDTSKDTTREFWNDKAFTEAATSLTGMDRDQLETLDPGVQETIAKDVVTFMSEARDSSSGRSGEDMEDLFDQLGKNHNRVKNLIPEGMMEAESGNSGYSVLRAYNERARQIYGNNPDMGPAEASQLAFDEFTEAVSGSTNELRQEALRDWSQGILGNSGNDITVPPPASTPSPADGRSQGSGAGAVPSRYSPGTEIEDVEELVTPPPSLPAPAQVPGRVPQSNTQVDPELRREMSGPPMTGMTRSTRTAVGADSAAGRVRASESSDSKVDLAYNLIQQGNLDVAFRGQAGIGVARGSQLDMAIENMKNDDWTNYQRLRSIATSEGMNIKQLVEKLYG